MRPYARPPGDFGALLALLDPNVVLRADHLAGGGKIKGPLTKQAGGGEVGWLMDKFGMNWMVSIDAP